MCPEVPDILFREQPRLPGRPKHEVTGCIEFLTRRAGRRIKWQQSRRLMPGTAVALSLATDNFQTMCKIATVAQRLYAGGLDKNRRRSISPWHTPRHTPRARYLIRNKSPLVSNRTDIELVRRALVGLRPACNGDTGTPGPSPGTTCKAGRGWGATGVRLGTEEIPIRDPVYTAPGPLPQRHVVCTPQSM